MKNATTILFFIFMLQVLPSFAQSESLNTTSASGSAESQKPIHDVATAAQFPGGEQALLRHVATKLKYPAEAVKQNLQGVVFLRFTVEKNGRVGNVRVVKGLSKECDAEAVRVVKRLPRFTPAKDKDGKPVPMNMKIPIRFVIH